MDINRTARDLDVDFQRGVRLLGPLNVRLYRTQFSCNRPMTRIGHARPTWKIMSVSVPYIFSAINMIKGQGTYKFYMCDEGQKGGARVKGAAGGESFTPN